MVPRIANPGKSFKGAAAYYLHDKGANTNKRVAFTHTRNLPTDDPQLAWKIMAHTAMDQQALKIEAGVKATGRKLKNSVYSYSLAWHPDETPDKEHMLEAARESLKALGMEQAQAILVAHNDEKHPHIHVIVNRVDPQTGKAFSNSNDRLKLSEWAEDYEKRHGRIYCEERVKNNEERKRGGYAKDEKSLGRWEYRRWQSQKRRLLNKALKDQRTHQWLEQKDVREKLNAQRNRELGRAKRYVKDKYRADWRNLYAQQAKDRAQLDQLNANIVGRLRYLLSNRKKLGVDGTNRGMLSQAFTVMTDSGALADRLAKKHKHERRAMGKAEQTVLARSFDKVWEQHRARFEKLRQEQVAARKHLRDRQSQTRIDEAQWRRGPEGLAEFVKEYFNRKGHEVSKPEKKRDKQGTSRSFDHASEGRTNDDVERLKKLRQRRARERKRDRGRGRGGRDPDQR